MRMRSLNQRLSRHLLVFARNQYKKLTTLLALFRHSVLVEYTIVLSVQMPYIRAQYSVCDTFEIPDTVRLLPLNQNVKGTPWSWWVVWGVLYYLDESLEEHEIYPLLSGSDGNFKQPTSFEDMRYLKDYCTQE